MAKSKVRLRGRFFLMILSVAGIIALTAVVVNLTKKTGEIQFGSLGANMEASAAVIRDETVVMSEPYEKITFDVVEGDTVNNDQVIAQLYKRGYQDETMVTLLNLQRQIYDYQMQLLGGQETPELSELNNSLKTVELQIRSVARGESTLDMLDLEQTLKDLISQRETLLKTVVTPDPALTQLYADLASQQNVIAGWKRDIKNTSGTGVVSFYFDGYEQVLNINKLSTINSALVKTVVKGGNTANTAASRVAPETTGPWAPCAASSGACSRESTDSSGRLPRTRHRQREASLLPCAASSSSPVARGARLPDWGSRSRRISVSNVAAWLPPELPPLPAAAPRSSRRRDMRSRAEPWVPICSRVARFHARASCTRDMMAADSSSLRRRRSASSRASALRASRKRTISSASAPTAGESKRPVSTSRVFSARAFCRR